MNSKTNGMVGEVWALNDLVGDFVLHNQFFFLKTILGYKCKLSTLSP